MYKNIMVAVDGSDTSNLALQEAVNLAHEQQAKLWIVHVIDLSLPPSADEGYVTFDVKKYHDSIRKTGKQLLSKMEALAHSVGITIETQLIENKDFSRISELIIKAIEKFKIDSLVAGTHGRKGFHRFLIGSVAEDIVRMSPVPMLLIRGSH